MSFLGDRGREDRGRVRRGRRRGGMLLYLRSPRRCLVGGDDEFDRLKIKEKAEAARMQQQAAAMPPGYGRPAVQPPSPQPPVGGQPAPPATSSPFREGAPAERTVPDLGAPGDGAARTLAAATRAHPAAAADPGHRGSGRDESLTRRSDR